jgi:hypothetical protein
MLKLDLVVIHVKENQTANVTLNACSDLFGKHEEIDDNSWISVTSNQLRNSRKSARYESLHTNQLIKTSPIHGFNYHR